MSSIEEEGQKIAQRLGQGVTYRGPWFLPGLKREFLGYFFQDDAVTESSFVAKTFEEAKASLIKTRKAFGAKPPVFGNNPGNTLIAIVGLGVSTLGAAAALTILKRSGSPAQRVYYEDDQYLVSVRYPGQLHDLRDFVQPDNPDVLAVYSQYGPESWALYDWVCKNVSYRLDLGEFWQTPSETLRGDGDCEDTSILFTSLIRAGRTPNCYVALGSYQGYGHAWGQLNGVILETTYTSARTVPDPEAYHGYCLFNEREVIEFWPGALDDIFGIRRNEAAKLGLMSQAVR